MSIEDDMDISITQIERLLTKQKQSKPMTVEENIIHNVPLLPEWRGDFMTESEFREEAQDYARANVSHATAAQAAEIEALRNLCGMAYQLAGVHDAPEPWLDALSNAAVGVPFETEGLLPYMPESVASTEALRAEVERLQSSYDQLYVHAESSYQARKQAEARAERLAEALRGLLNDTQHKDHNCGDAEWCPVIAARAALEQETTNG